MNLLVVFIVLFSIHNRINYKLDEQSNSTTEPTPSLRSSDHYNVFHYYWKLYNGDKSICYQTTTLTSERSPIQFY